MDAEIGILASKFMQIIKHTVFWFIVLLVLTFVFGQSNDQYVQAFYFVSLLMPVMIGLNYFFNYYLVPVFLLKRKYWLFGLYSFYTVIVSLYLETMVLLIAFIVLANYNYYNLNPAATNVFLLGVVLYGIIFLVAFIRLVKMNFSGEQKLFELMKQTDPAQNHVSVRADRKTYKIRYDEILYVESLADYVRIIRLNGEPLITREKISAISKLLPHEFLRIHRSFIVNITRIESFNREYVSVAQTEIPIGRTFKKEVIDRLDRSTATEMPISS